MDIYPRKLHPRVDDLFIFYWFSNRKELQMGMEMDISKRKEVAVRAAGEAGKFLLDNFGRRVRAMVKGDRDLFSKIDLKAEEKIIRMITKNFPYDDILSEERVYKPVRSDFRWVIDPLDGTHNYIRSIAIFGTSIAVEYKGEVILGVIYMPVTEELYVGQKGHGAFCNGKRIHVSMKSLIKATIIYDSTLHVKKKDMIAGLNKLGDKIFNIRMFGSSVRSLSYIAEGKADGGVEFNDKPWDYAAGLLLVEEAGGKATGLQGKPWNTSMLGYVVSNGLIHKHILSIITSR